MPPEYRQNIVNVHLCCSFNTQQVSTVDQHELVLLVVDNPDLVLIDKFHDSALFQSSIVIVQVERIRERVMERADINVPKECLDLVNLRTH